MASVPTRLMRRPIARPSSDSTSLNQCTFTTGIEQVRDRAAGALGVHEVRGGLDEVAILREATTLSISSQLRQQ